MRFVLDGSVALSWAFKDERTSESLAVLAALTTGEADVPAIWPMEVANGMVTGIRKKRLDLDAAQVFLADLSRAKITVWPSEIGPMRFLPLLKSTN